MTGFPVASSGSAVRVSGYTVPDRAATHLFPTTEGMVHRTGEVIPDRFSAAVLDPGAGNEALAVQFMAVHLEGQRPPEAAQAAPSPMHRRLGERALPLLQAQALGGLLAPPAGDRQENNYRRS
jgi:hypothetical protein